MAKKINNMTVDQNTIMTSLVKLAGPISWPIMGLLGWMASQGPDGGWSGMAVMFIGLAIILIIHVISPIILMIMAASRKRNGKKIEATLALALCYYGLAVIVVLLLIGPRELISDSAVLLQNLFTNN